MSTLTPLVYLSTTVPSLVIPSRHFILSIPLKTLRPLFPGTRHPSNQAWTSQCRQALATPHFSSCLSPLAYMSDHPESLKKLLHLFINVYHVYLYVCAHVMVTGGLSGLQVSPGSQGPKSELSCLVVASLFHTGSSMCPQPLLRLAPLH